MREDDTIEARGRPGNTTPPQVNAAGWLNTTVSHHAAQPLPATMAACRRLPFFANAAACCSRCWY